MTPEMIRQLPGGCALVIRGGLSPVIARLPMAWKDPAYKRARRAGHAIAALAPVPQAAAVPTATPVRHTHHAPRARPAAQPADEALSPHAPTAPPPAPATATGSSGPGSEEPQMTTPGPLPGDAIAAALLQITQHAERLALLDDREAQHYQQIAERLREVAAQLSGMSTRVDGVHGTIAGQADILASLEGLDDQVAAIAAQLAELAPATTRGDEHAKPYTPIPPPQWWKLTGGQREEAIARLRAWVEMIYLPGYGRLAAMLAPCWDQHPLCLYTLDWLAELWSVLYLTPRRTGGSLAAQGEWQTRLLPAAAEQMHMETSDCEHTSISARHQPSLGTRLNRT